MDNAIFSFPNWSDEAAAVLFGGDWSAGALSRLQLDDINNRAITADATADSTKLEVDIGASRDIRVIAFDNNSLSVRSTRRVRVSNTAAFSGATVSGAHSSGVSSVSFQAGTSFDLNISEGDAFTIEGDSTIYTATAGATISSSATGSVSFTPVLAENAADEAVITCRSGDYTDALYDDGEQVDVYDTIYPFGTLPFYHPSWLDGKPTQRDIDEGTFPLVIVLPKTIFARYMKVEFVDESNPDGQISIGRMFFARGVQPTYNIAYGETTVGFTTQTKVETALSGRRIYTPKPMQRIMPIGINNLPKREALTTFFDMQRKLGKHKQLFFIMQPDEPEFTSRTSFTATLAELDPFQFPYFNVNNVGMQLMEAI